MSHSITTREIDEIPLLVMRDKVEREQIGQALGRMFPAVFAYATQNGIPITGAPLVRYTSMGEDGMGIEAGLPVAPGSPGQGDIHATSIPAGRVATTLHRGPHEDLYSAHLAVHEWLEENDVEANGHPWEFYVNDPTEVSGPEEYLTEIYVPID